MNWNNCFSTKRLDSEHSDADYRNEYERDWDRLIFSSAFRRLQNKTQVFPLPEEIFVHNRLTHSLEVASVGRSLGKLIGDKLATLDSIKNDERAKDFYENSLKHVISAACLAHDLGNPAFGHSGEEAISKYFKRRDNDDKDNLAFKALFSENEWKDLITFEGNANAFRIITQHQKNKQRGGFKLTFSTIGSILKYPCESLASEGKKGHLHRKKYGYFKIDEATFETICKTLNMIRDETTEKIAYKRHPFVFLVEAADDICYNIIDFEDAHRLGILDFDTVKSIFFEIILSSGNENRDTLEQKISQYADDKNECIAYLRAKCISTLTYHCAEVFIQNKDIILKGDFNSSLIDAIEVTKNTMKKLTKINIEKIYNNKDVIKLEVAGFKIMYGLVEDFVQAALTPFEERGTEYKKILALMPTQYHFEESATPYEKVMHIIDFISGMTDLYALKLYRKLRGIEL